LQIFFARGGRAFLQGIFTKTSGFGMVFCGEVVVVLWWECGFWMVDFQRRKMSWV
jgi:hypothetical protein